jgi:predicted transcriptional regulator of viral defense system
MEARTQLERLREVAIDQHGFVTAAQAAEEGVPFTELAKMKARGRLAHVAHGVYRVPQVAETQYDDYQLAVLWTGAPEACLSHETALEVWGVSDINPDRIHVAVAQQRRLRRAGGERYAIHRVNLAESDVTWWEGIPTATLPVSIGQCITAGVPTYLIRQALERGTRTSRLSEAGARELHTALEDRDGAV